MHHHGGVLPDAHAAFEQVSVFDLLGAERGFGIALLAGDEDPDVDSSRGPRRKDVQDALRRDEVGVGDPESLARACAQQLGQALRAGEDGRARARHECRDRRARRVCDRERVCRQQGAPRFLPVFGEGLLGVEHGRTRKTHAGVTPAACVDAVSEPVVAYAEASGDGDPPVEDHDLAMVPSELVNGRLGAEHPHFAAGVLERQRDSPLEVGAPDVVHENSTSRPALGARDQRLREAVRCLARFPDVHHHVDALRRLLGLVHERIEHGSVFQQGHSVPGQHANSEALKQGQRERLAGRSRNLRHEPKVTRGVLREPDHERGDEGCDDQGRSRDRQHDFPGLAQGLLPPRSSARALIPRPCSGRSGRRSSRSVARREPCSRVRGHRPGRRLRNCTAFRRAVARGSRSSAHCFQAWRPKVLFRRRRRRSRVISLLGFVGAALVFVSRGSMGVEQGVGRDQQSDDRGSSDQVAALPGARIRSRTRSGCGAHGLPTKHYSCPVRLGSSRACATPDDVLFRPARVLLVASNFAWLRNS